MCGKREDLSGEDRDGEEILIPESVAGKHLRYSQ
jgi:hypothetical protein